MYKLLKLDKCLVNCEQAYMYAVARTVMIDKFRKDGRRPTQHAMVYDDYAEDGLVGAAEQRPDYQYQEWQLISAINQELNTLTPLQQQAFNYSVWRGGACNRLLINDRLQLVQWRRFPQKPTMRYYSNYKRKR